MEKLNFNLVTPEKELLSADVTMAVVPGSEGEMGIMRQYAPLVSTLRVGLLSLYDDDDQLMQHFFVSGGFVNVYESACVVMADEAIPLDELNESDVQESIKSIKELIATTRTEEERLKHQDELDLAEAKIHTLRYAFSKK